ncbi:MAG: hypothetical protein ACOYON_12665 [Fimbriimonas sp.]
MQILADTRDELVVFNPNTNYRVGGSALIVLGMIALGTGITLLVGSVGANQFLSVIAFLAAGVLLTVGIKLFIRVKDKTLTFKGRMQSLAYVEGDVTQNFRFDQVERAYVKVRVGNSEGPSRYELRVLLACDPLFIDVSHEASARTAQEYSGIADKINGFLAAHQNIPA